MARMPMIAALLLVAGCAPEADRKAEVANNAVDPAVPAPAAVPGLEGEWRLTKLDGRPIGGGSALVATFGGGSVRLASGCLRRGWTYTQDRNIVAFTANPGGSANCGGSPSADHEAAFYALNQATIAIFDKQGREVSLSGNGGNVTLERR